MVLVQNLEGKSRKTFRTRLMLVVLMRPWNMIMVVEDS